MSTEVVAQGDDLVGHHHVGLPEVNNSRRVAGHAVGGPADDAEDARPSLLPRLARVGGAESGGGVGAVEAVGDRRDRRGKRRDGDGRAGGDVPGGVTGAVPTLVAGVRSAPGRVVDGRHLVGAPRGPVVEAEAVGLGVQGLIVGGARHGEPERRLGDHRPSERASGGVGGVRHDRSTERPGQEPEPARAGAQQREHGPLAGAGGDGRRRATLPHDVLTGPVRRASARRVLREHDDELRALRRRRQGDRLSGAGERHPVHRRATTARGQGDRPGRVVVGATGGCNHCAHDVLHALGVERARPGGPGVDDLAARPDLDQRRGARREVHGDRSPAIRDHMPTGAILGKCHTMHNPRWSSFRNCVNQIRS